MSLISRVKTSTISRQNNLVIEKIGPHSWYLMDPLTYKEDNGKYITVPPGFVTNGSSCPPILFNFCAPMDGPQAEACVLHDWLYSSESNEMDIDGDQGNRYEVDKLFLNAMISDGTPGAEALMIYEAVRVGGLKFWKRNKTDDHPKKK